MFRLFTILQNVTNKLNATDELQTSIIDQHIQNIQNKSLYKITNTSLLDAIVYTRYLYNNNLITLDTYEYCLVSFRTLISYYDIIYYADWGISLLSSIYEYYIQQYAVKVERVVGSNLLMNQTIQNTFTKYFLNNNLPKG